MNKNHSKQPQHKAFLTFFKVALNYHQLIFRHTYVCIKLLLSFLHLYFCLPKKNTKCSKSLKCSKKIIEDQESRTASLEGAESEISVACCLIFLGTGSMVVSGSPNRVVGSI